MEVKPPDRTLLNKLNSFLLTLATAGIIYIVGTLTSIDKRLGNLETAFGIRVGETAEIKSKQEDHTTILSDIVIRLTRLETIQNEKHGSNRN